MTRYIGRAMGVMTIIAVTVVFLAVFAVVVRAAIDLITWAIRP